MPTLLTPASTNSQEGMNESAPSFIGGEELVSDHLNLTGWGVATELCVETGLPVTTYPSNLYRRHDDRATYLNGLYTAAVILLVPGILEVAAPSLLCLTDSGRWWMLACLPAVSRLVRRSDLSWGKASALAGSMGASSMGGVTGLGSLGGDATGITKAWSGMDGCAASPVS